MPKSPNFDKMSLFQLMIFCEDNNYDDDWCEIVQDLPDYNPFEVKPDSFAGTDEEWEVEIETFSKLVEEEYREICKKIYKIKGGK